VDILVVLEDVSSQQFLEITVLACPMCNQPMMPDPLRAGLAAFVAATVCPACGCRVRANDAFSIEPEPG
jgi:hypothetical protein